MNLIIVERKATTRKTKAIQSVDELVIEKSVHTSANCMNSAGIQEYMRKLGVTIVKKGEKSDGLV